jgi:UPF0755 protein
MKRWLVLIALVLFVAAGLTAWRQFIRLAMPFKDYGGAEQFVEIEPGTAPAAIGRRLVESGVVRDIWTWRIALWRSGASTRLQAGEYRFDRPLNVDQVIGVLARGEVYLRTITFPEGLTIRQMARLYETRGLGTAAAFTQAAADPAPIAALDPQARDLEGYLFPDTYTVPRRMSAADLVGQMASRFTTMWTPDLQAAAGALGLTVRQAVTLASLVEKETARPDERATVSAVYHNRLRIRMGLQCDPTVIYALERAGRYTGNLTRADLSFDSPYNTYRYAGLPPGPIAAPGRASLAAAVQPADVPYVYFVSRNDGSHAFASSLDEHNRNVFRFQVQYFRQHTGRQASDARSKKPE